MKNHELMRAMEETNKILKMGPIEEDPFYRFLAQEETMTTDEMCKWLEEAAASYEPTDRDAKDYRAIAARLRELEAKREELQEAKRIACEVGASAILHKCELRTAVREMRRLEDEATDTPIALELWQAAKARVDELLERT